MNKALNQCKTAGIVKRILITPLVFLLCSCNGNGSYSELERYLEYLTVDNMLEYCSTDGVYDGGGRFYLDHGVDSHRIVDDGRLCEALLAIDITPTALSIQCDPVSDLTDLISYYVPYDDYACIVIYDGDYICCEAHPDLSPSYYRYYKIEDGMANTLLDLAMDIRDGVDS